MINFPRDWQDVICYIYQGNVNVYEDLPQNRAQRTMRNENDKNSAFIISQHKGGSIFRVNKDLRMTRKYECTVQLDS